MYMEWLQALIGGVLIGLSVSLMLFWNGRVTGISGIIGGIFSPTKGDTQWRLLFLLGLVFGGLVLSLLNPNTLNNTLNPSASILVLAGLLVGIGTLLGSGCTSGHGVCGISRMSPRSIVATFVFMLSGILTVFLLRWMGVFL